MPWRYESDDGLIEIVVDPRFGGDLLELARRRVVYAVYSEQNKASIDRYEADRDTDRCVIERFTVADPDDRVQNLLDILVTVDTHYYPYPGFVVHGTPAIRRLVEALAERGVSIREETPDGFVGVIADDAPKYGLTALTEFLEKEGGARS